MLLCVYLNVYQCPQCNLLTYLGYFANGVNKLETIVSLNLDLWLEIGIVPHSRS